MKRKSLVWLLVALLLLVSIFYYADFLKDDRRQAEIDTKFSMDYGNLIIGMLNRSLQTDEDAIHKYDAENTKYGYRLVELYPHNSHLTDSRFLDILMLLDQASGCDAWYEIKMDKELYDRLNALGQAIFSKPQRYTAEQLEEVWNALCAAVDFSVK